MLQILANIATLLSNVERQNEVEESDKSGRLE